MAKKPPRLEELLPKQYDHIVDLDDLLARPRAGDLVVGDNIAVEPAVTERKAYSLDAILQRDHADPSDPTHK